MCVCVCVCVCREKNKNKSDGMQIKNKIKNKNDILKRYIYLYMDIMPMLNFHFFLKPSSGQCCYIKNYFQIKKIK